MARVLGPNRIVVGRDPRASGPALQSAFESGVAAEGVDVEDAGVLPTPALAAMSEAHDVPAAVITASHNPHTDNGVKVFASGGRKIVESVQSAIEAELRRIASATPSGSIPRRAGSVVRSPDPIGWYVDRCVALFEPDALAGSRVVLDTSNGAMSVAAPRTFRALGADVVTLNDAPDGTNINRDCGATSPSALCDFVGRMNRADVAFAFDGDGDRVIAVDELGHVVDGDRLLALSAIDRKRRGRLAGGVVVATVMANLGFHRAMEAAGIQVVTTAVGDRFVLDAMDEGGFVLGGEQSGHIIHRDMATTGDGLLAAIDAAILVKRSGRAFSGLASGVMTAYPQVLRNVRVARRPADPAAEMSVEIARESEALGASGRVLVRASGTEPVVRVMVEAPSEALADAAVERLCRVASDRFG